MRSAGSLTAPFIQPIARKLGFVQSRILLEWPNIVGSFHKFCAPEKVNWDKLKKQGRLTLRVASAMASHVRYYEPQILDRLNQFFGYQAITQITVISDSSFSILKEQTSETSQMAEITEEELSPFQDIEDERLKLALAKLSKSILSGKNT